LPNRAGPTDPKCFTAVVNLRHSRACAGIQALRHLRAIACILAAMGKRIIPIHERAQLQQRVSAAAPSTPDRRGRHIHDLRISVTDRCNFRCLYCMPKTVYGRDFPFLPRRELLDFEEISRIARIFAARGVRKIRLTGGEPLLRHDIEELIVQLAAIPGIEITLTTNGSLLAPKARSLRSAGLHRITVSLDALDEATFGRMNDVGCSVATVLEGIASAEAAGFGPIKINMVVKRGTNDQAILPMARHFRGSGHIVRFIEYMDVGGTQGWCMNEVLPSAEVLQRIAAEYPLEAVAPAYSGEVAERWRYVDGGGEIGVVASVTQAFCATCTRARLSTDGKLYTCLFAAAGHDLRTLLRSGCDDKVIEAAIAAIWQERDDHYSEIRSAGTPTEERVDMHYIGG
jgi:cyclic pyranopterin phosphate synthase